MSGEPVLLVDDAKIGIDPRDQSLLAMGKHAKLSRKEWGAVLIALGMAGAGILMVAAAILDPEPTSKLGLLIVSGGVIALSGGFTAIKILTKQKPPRVRIGKDGFEIGWD